MKRLFLFFIFTVAVSYLQAQTKHALVVGIGDYKYWPDISSSNDVPFIKTTLLKQGFPEQQIILLTDSMATKAGIGAAFKTLIGRVKKGDIVVIHFSSHGEQVEDDNKEETDGLDEAIVSYDAMYPVNRENFSTDQVKYFRDDQFGNYIDELRSRLGEQGDVIVFIDACHSGSGTRGSRKVRGGAAPLVSKNYKAPGKEIPGTGNVFRENKIQPEEKMATYVVISAARAGELNTEADNDGTDMGSLSLAIGKVFEKLSPGTTYRSFFSNLLSFMNEIVPEQHPVIEGNGLDRELFGGRFIEQKPFIEVEAIHATRLTLRGGSLMGLDSGAKVAVYPSGTNDPAASNPVARGIISVAEPFTSSVILDTFPGLLQPSAYWVFVTEPVYKIRPVIIQVGSGGSAINFSEPEITAIKNTITGIPVAKTDGSPDLLLVKGSMIDSLKIASNGYLFSTVAATDKKELLTQLKRYVQYNFLQQLQLADRTSKLEIRLVPFIHGKADTSKDNQKLVNGIYEFNVNDSLLVWVKNKGDKAIYFNILDLQPDGVINPILPNTRLQPPIYPADLKVEAGQEILFDKYKITIAPPYGMEIFKIFVSEAEINMEGIAISAGLKPRGNFTLLEKLVNNSYSIATRGAKIENSGKAEGSTFNLLFRIKPAKEK
jgi:hypothetical protein